MRAPRRFLLACLAIGLFCIVLFLSRATWLSTIGHFLVLSDPPEKADAILVLAGDWHGRRILAACDLVKSGYAPLILVSGPVKLYGVNEADAAIRFATEKGCNPQWFEPLYNKALSTFEEARDLIPMVQRRQIRKLLIVTSSYHTRRAGRLFTNAAAGNPKLRMVSAPDVNFEPSSWWQNREGQKIVFFEASKTLAGWAGL